MKKGLALLLLALLIGPIGLFAQDEPIVTIIINTSMPEFSQVSVAPYTGNDNPTFGDSLVFNFFGLDTTQNGQIGFLKYSTNNPNGIKLEITGEELKNTTNEEYTIPYTLSLEIDHETQKLIKFGYEDEDIATETLSTPSNLSTRFESIIPIYLTIPGTSEDYVAGSYEGVITFDLKAI